MHYEWPWILWWAVRVVVINVSRFGTITNLFETNVCGFKMARRSFNVFTHIHNSYISQPKSSPFWFGYNMNIFDQYFESRSKFRTISILDQNFEQFWFSTKISNHFQQFRFSTIISNNFQQFRFSTIISNNFQQFRFSTKLSNHFQQFRFSTIISNNFQQFRFSTNISNNFQQFRFSTKISNNFQQFRCWKKNWFFNNFDFDKKFLFFQ